jgi:hypothetical protein
VAIKYFLLNKKYSVVLRFVDFAQQSSTRTLSKNPQFLNKSGVGDAAHLGNNR